MPKDRTPHPPNPPRPSGVTNVGWATAIDTHNLAGTIVPKRVAPPLAPAVYQGPDHRALCALRRPTCPQSNDIERSQAGMQPQQRKHIGASPPYGEDTPDRRQVQRKEKEGGTSAKSSVLMLTCVPLPHLVLPLSGWPAQAPRQWQHEVRQGDTHDSGFAAIRGVPLPNQQRKICDGTVRVKALRLGRKSGSSCVNGVSPWCTEPPVTEAHHRNDTNPPRNAKGSYPLPHPSPPDHLG